MYKDFGYDDDTVIQTLENSMEELKKAKLDYPGPAPSEELPRRPFGVFKEPTFEAKIGRRAEQFSEVENSTKEHVMRNTDVAARESVEAHLSVGDGPELAGTDTDSEFSNDECECTKL